MGFEERIGDLVIHYFDENWSGYIYNAQDYRNDVRRTQVACSTHIARIPGAEYFSEISQCLRIEQQMLDDHIAAHDEVRARKIRGRTAKPGRAEPSQR